MRKNTHSPLLTAAVFAAAWCAVAGTPVADAAKHPRLVSIENAKCETCHEELIQKSVVHPPTADDCQSCHEFSAEEEGLSVALMATGPELCVMCHDAMEAASAGELEAPHAPVLDDCTNCHDPHSTDNEHLLVAAVGELCQGCHDSDEMNTAHAVPVSRSDCRSCHDPHGSASAHMLTGSRLHAPFEDGACQGCHKKPRGTMIRLVAEGSALCFACHGDLEGPFSQGSVHTPVRTGDCIGCHDPHMASQAKQLRLPGSELCFSCHEDVELKATGSGAHAAVADGCDGCHDPHHSEHANQLVDTVPSLCLMCHDAEDEDLTAKHLGSDLNTTACTTCHDPHGSSQGNLIADGSIHPPFLDGCDTCHEGAANSLVEDGGKALCYACHSEIEDQVTNASVQHAAIEAGECVDCHSPHSSRHQKLLRSEGSAVCTTCHDDLVPGPDQMAHAVIDWFGCQSCHLPHGGDNERLLRQTGNDLCNGCHLVGEVKANDAGTAEFPGGFVVDSSRLAELERISLDPERRLNHPVTSHPVAGIVAEGTKVDIPDTLVGTEFSCLSCHEPHMGRSQMLFRYGAVSSAQICLACHPK